MDLLRDCVEAMQKAGIDQWDDVYPDRQTMSRDIESGTLYGGYVDVCPVGIIVINDHQNVAYDEVLWSFRARHVAVIHRLMVSPSYEGQGFGRQLMEFAEAHARERGYHVVRLDAFAKNRRALRLYDRLGYRDAGAVMFRKGTFRCFEKNLVSER